MIDPYEFAQRQMELTAELSKLVIERPEIDEALPEESYVYFEIAGDPAFSKYSHELALRRQREDGVAIVCIRAQGLAPPQGSRFIEPQVVPIAA